jgi:hypothetical protein
MGGCIARSDKPFQRITDDEAPPPPPLDLGSGGADGEAPGDLEVAPHVVLGIDPPHGPFAGGTLVMIRGNGFASDTRVWFGDVEVPKPLITPVDPQRIQVVTPAGSAGAVDVVVQNGRASSTRAELRGGFTYDRFYAAPASGPTSGGTIITLWGDKTNWDESTEVAIDREPCEIVELINETKLTCATPRGSAGSKVLSVTTGDGEREDVLDGFLYGNSDNGFRGGLSGQPLTSELTVVVFDNFEGRAIPGVSVLIGEDAESGVVAKTDADGVVTFSGELGPQRSVTIVKKCFQPITFFDVPVDHVTAYLDPILSPDCIPPLQGELPGGGGTPGLGAGVVGELVWEADGELRRRGWTNVPAPASDSEREVAYVFRLSGSPDGDFRLPSAVNAVTPAAEGTRGYRFSQSTPPGNFTLYALAGLEDTSRSPAVFTAYAMGLLRGVSVKPGRTAEDVFIPIDVPLDHALTLALDPPEAGARGPDRISASVAIQIQDQGYALLPNGVQSRSLLAGSSFSFVGVPPLVGTLAGTRYVLGARAVTGAAEAAPLSVIGNFSSTTSNEVLNLGGFVPLPVLEEPASGGKWDLSALRLSLSPKGERVDLTVVEIEAGGGLVRWTLAAPGPRSELVLPDLKALDEQAGLPVGTLDLTVSLAHIPEFDYGSLRYRELAPRGWFAYAQDSIAVRR